MGSEEEEEEVESSLFIIFHTHSSVITGHNSGGVSVVTTLCSSPPSFQYLSQFPSYKGQRGLQWLDPSACRAQISLGASGLMRIICSDSKVVLTSHGHASSNLPFTDLDYLFTVCTQWTQYTQRVSYCILYAEPFQRATLESGKKGPHVRWNGFEWEVTLITIDSTRTRTRTSKSTRVPVGSNADHH